MATLDLMDVRKAFGATQVLHGVDLGVADGEMIVIVGASGCGKSTLLRIVAGLETATSGHVRIDGRDVTALEPADRDIAMVFQNYALYPHMTVAQNMGYGLKIRGLARAEIARRVQEAAGLLGIEALLDRRPRQLSGGQRQRVAMGRAIVREPQAFLMDEPLSNLDAKLRVQMRAEIHTLQRRVGVTTLYVTHDQVEAMTLGDRVAVMRDGHLQQVDTPQALYDNPVNQFVAGFIGSPSINLVEAELERADGDLQVTFGGHRLPIDSALASRHSGLENFVGKKVQLGIRPEDIEDAELESDAPSDRRFRTTVDLREALGSEVLVHFSVAEAPVLTEDTKELARDMGVHETQERQATTTTFVARLDPRTRAQERESIELVVDTARLHFFDPQTGLGIDTEGGLG